MFHDNTYASQPPDTYEDETRVKKHPTDPPPCEGSTDGGAEVVASSAFLPRAILSLPICEVHLT